MTGSGFTEEQQYLIESLIDMCQENDWVLPTKRQVKKNSFISLDEVINSLGRGNGWQGVMNTLKKELDRRRMPYEDAGEPGNSAKSGKKKKKKKGGQGGSQQGNTVNSELKTDVALSPADTEPSDTSDEATTKVVAEEVVTEEAAVEITPAIEEVVLVKTSANEESVEEVIVSDESEAVVPKKRGRKPQEFSRDGEIAKLCEYKELLGGKDPTPARLTKLAKEYPDKKITCGATLEKRLGSYKEWPTLIADYIARKKKTEAE